MFLIFQLHHPWQREGGQCYPEIEGRCFKKVISCQAPVVKAPAVVLQRGPIPYRRMMTFATWPAAAGVEEHFAY